MDKQTDRSNFKYNLKRVDKVSLIIIWVLIAIILEQAFLKGTDKGIRVMFQAIPVGILATAIYFLNLKRFLKSLLFGLIPTIAVCFVIFTNEFSLDRHYMICVATVIIALYFNRKLMVVYGSIVNVLLLALYLFRPVNLLGDSSSVVFFMSIFFMFNAQVIVLFFLTKWGGEILDKALKNNEEIQSLFEKLQLASDTERKQSDYQKAHVDKLLGNLKMIARGELACDLAVKDADEDTLDAYETHKAINDNFKLSILAIEAMASDITVLSAAAQNGELGTRADVSGYTGEYRKIVEGMNLALDAIQHPIDDVSGMMTEILNGNLGVVVNSRYGGSYSLLIDSVNKTIVNLKSIIGEISTVLTEMAQGNLNVSISADYQGEFEEIKYSLNNIIESFNAVLSDIGTASDQVANGTAQVASGAQALSQGATEQASAIEQLTESVGQIAGQTKQNAINAGRASDLSAAARDNAELGNERMGEMLKSMQDINEASASISKIIKVIDEIAFQTNLLALNAAVEAARAGQYGKGFAVVAEEVRSLAARSASAAKETTELIEGTVRKVEAGTRIANETAAALNSIMSGVEKTTELVSGIASASNEQATAVAQVSRGIEQVAQVVQTTSATAEESAATSEQLSGQAEHLKEMVGRFSFTGKKARPRILTGNIEFGKY